MIRRHSQNLKPQDHPKCEPTASVLALRLKDALERHKRERAER